MALVCDFNHIQSGKDSIESIHIPWGKRAYSFIPHTGADPILAWPRFGANHRALPGMQTTFSQCSERSHRPGTGLIMSPWSIIPCRLIVPDPGKFLETRFLLANVRIADNPFRTVPKLRENQESAHSMGQIRVARLVESGEFHRESPQHSPTHPRRRFIYDASSSFPYTEAIGLLQSRIRRRAPGKRRAPR